MFPSQRSIINLIILSALLCTPAAYGAQETVTVHAVSLNGTPKYPKGFTHFDYANPDAPKGGTLNACAIGTFDSFNPYILRGRPAEGIGLIYDSLLTPSNDEPSSYYGLVADSLTFPKDLSHVIYHIHPAARFHDGTKITARDIVFSFQTLMNNFGNVLKKYYADISRADILDDSRVKFSFRKKRSRELVVITGQIPVLPAHFWKTNDFSAPGLVPPLGSGPYRIKSFHQGRSITYERIPDYWARDLPVMKGRYNFNRIRYDYFRDGVVALEAFRAGLYDYRVETSAKKWATMYSGPEFDTGNIIKAEVKHSVPIGMQGLIFNTRRPIFKSPRVRRALMYAFDYEWANQRIYYGQYKRISSYFSNCELEAPPLPSEKELEILTPFRDRLPGGLFTRRYTVPDTNGSGYPRANLIRASRLLEQEGWEIRDKKLVNRQTGKPFRFEYLSDAMGREKILLPFKKNLEKLGIDMVIRRVDSPQYTARLRKCDFDMIAAVFCARQTPGSELMLYWHSSNAMKKDARNFAGVQDPVVDHLVESIVSARGRTSLVHRVHALDRVLLWGNYIIPFGASRNWRLAHRKEIKRPDADPGNTLEISTWWKETN